MRGPVRELQDFAPAAADAAGLPALPPDGSKLICGAGDRVYRLVPVSFVAKDWKVTPRRIRALLAAGRLEGRAQENGYWEVLWPYRVTLGSRGPSPKREKKAARKAE